MSFWSRWLGPRERPEVTLRLTRQALDLMTAGKTDEEVERALFREGVTVERAASLVAEVRRVQRMMRGAAGRAVLFAALGLAAGAPCAAQTAADSAPKPPADSTPSPSADTARRTRTVAAPAPVPVPLDSALAASCASAPTAGGPTADLLVVIFMAGTEASELASVATSAGGTLAGPAGPGGTAFYVRVGSEPQAIVADRLIRAAPVRMVTPAACPPRPVAAPPDTAKKPPAQAPQPPS